MILKLSITPSTFYKITKQTNVLLSKDETVIRDIYTVHSGWWGEGRYTMDVLTALLNIFRITFKYFVHIQMYIFLKDPFDV